jgi:hypothetical protein
MAAIRDDKLLCIRAGTGAHRFIKIWAVVVDDRVFVRSWDRKRGGWYRTFVDDPHGAIQLGDREIRVRAAPVTSERIKGAIDRAYAEKYTTPGAIKYVKGFARAPRRDATMELVPAP